MAEKPDEKRLTIRLPRELHKRLKVYAAKKELAVNELVVEAIRARVPT
jgi:predicted HicB family RNase H-like nuclease